MSLPHTGKLTVEIRSPARVLLADFNGNTWTVGKLRDPASAAAAEALQDLLNDVTADTSRTHLDIFELATRILRRAGLEQRATIRPGWKSDTWSEDLPDGAID